MHLMLFHFDEPQFIPPIDSTGNLGQMSPNASWPDAVVAWAGRGASFTQAAESSETGADNIAGATLSIRDVTIRAILSLTFAGAAGPQTIICRGLNDGTADEPIAYGLEVEQQAGNPGFVEVRMFHQDSAGTIHTQPAGVFQHLGDGKFFVLAATRRWESSSKIVTRYFVSGEMIAEVTTTNGDIAGATLGHTIIGGRATAGAIDRYLNGVIDELLVDNIEVSPEELRQDWLRLAVHQPAGVTMFAGLAPPGAPWYLNPGNNVGKAVRIAGEALGMGLAAAEELRELWLPDKATIDNIGRWERLNGLVPRPRDSLDVRRARVVAFMSRRAGFSIPGLQLAFAEPFDLDATAIQILEFSNTITDSFDALATERWWVGDAGTWSIVAGELKIHAVAGTDLRWSPTHATSWVITPLAETGGQPFIAQVKLSTYWASLPTNTMVGLFLFNYRTGDALWFGVKDVAGVRKLGWMPSINGIMGAFTVLVTPSLDQAYWLRVVPPTGAVGGIGTYRFGWSTTGPTTGFTEAQITTGVASIEWAGVAATSLAATIATDLNATFDDFVLRSINGDRPFYWYAFRDPALAGNADLPGAVQLALKLRPAQTYAGVTENRSVIWDDGRDGLWDRGPLGAL